MILARARSQGLLLPASGLAQPLDPGRDALKIELAIDRLWGRPALPGDLVPGCR
jgi:hypothetical protein